MTNTYSQLPPSSMSNFVPGHHPHSSSLSSLSSFAPQPHSYSHSHSHSPHASLSSSSISIPGPVGQVQTNHTRILLLADFPPSLKTKDLQEALSEWQDEPGGLKVKWRDDTSAWVVFGEPVVAKRAFLSLVTSPPPILTHSPSASSPSAPPIKIEPYTGPEVQQILQAVQNRPRSRSIAGQGGVSGPGGAAAGAVGVASSGGGGGHVGGHSRKGSLLGSGGGSALGAAIASAQAAGPHGAATSSSSTGGGSPIGGGSSPHGHGHGGHARTGSWQRSSLSSLSGFRAAVNANSNGGTSPTSGGGPGEEGRSSPETPGAGIVGGGANGVVAGEAPRRFGGGGGGGVGGAGGGGHQRRESRSGSDSVAASVAGLTIQE